MESKKPDYEKMYYQAMDEMQRAGVTPIIKEFSRAENDILVELVAEKLSDHVDEDFINDADPGDSDDGPKYKSNQLAEYRKIRKDLLEGLLQKLQNK